MRRSRGSVVREVCVGRAEGAVLGVSGVRRFDDDACACRLRLVVRTARVRVDQEVRVGELQGVLAMRERRRGAVFGLGSAIPVSKLIFVVLDMCDHRNFYPVVSDSTFLIAESHSPFSRQ